MSRTFNDEELENIQAEFIRNTLRQMAEDGGVNQSMSNLSREERKRFIANLLQTKVRTNNLRSRYHERCGYSRLFVSFRKSC